MGNNIEYNNNNPHNNVKITEKNTIHSNINLLQAIDFEQIAHGIEELHFYYESLNELDVKILGNEFCKPDCTITTLDLSNINFVETNRKEEKFKHDGLLTLLLQSVCENKSIIEINLDGVPKSDRDLEVLFEGILCSNTNQLKLLDLRSEFGNDNDGWCGIINASFLSKTILCHENCKLQQLDLSYNYIRESGAEALAMVLSNDTCTIVNLMLRHTYINGSGLGFIAQALERNNSLQELDIGHNEFESIDVESLATSLVKNKSLVKLDLDDISLEDDAITAIANMVHLQQPNGTFRKLILGQSFWSNEALFTLSNLFSILYEVDLCHSVITNDGAQYLAKALEKPDCVITKLNLTGIEIDYDGVIRLGDAFYTNKSLEQLVIGNMHIVCTSYDEAKQVNNSVVILANAIGQNLRITHVDMHQIGFTDAVSISLVEAFFTPQCNNIQVLDFSHTEFGDVGAKAIANVLAQNNVMLKRLNLEYASIKDTGFIALAEALRNNTSLTALDLSASEHVNDRVMFAFADTLFCNCTLEILCLNFWKMTEIGASRLADALEHNFHIKTLRISWHEFSSQTANRLKKALIMNNNKFIVASKMNWFMNTKLGGKNI
jgi:hypothetical protein